MVSTTHNRVTAPRSAFTPAPAFILPKAGARIIKLYTDPQFNWVCVKRDELAHIMRDRAPLSHFTTKQRGASVYVRQDSPDYPRLMKAWAPLCAEHQWDLEFETRESRRSSPIRSYDQYVSE